jgi:cell wall-associated NlpC family hydrolase
MAIRHKAGTIAGSMAVLSLALTGIANAQTQSFNQKAAGYVETFIGHAQYAYGGSSPSTGFDCSGLTSYVYGHFGKPIPRTAEAQFQRFRRISESRAWGGDLVFFHVNSSPSSYVYHVGIYEGNGRMVSAADPAEGILRQTIWSPAVTFGTITH